MLKHKTPSSFSGLATARAEINPTRALPVIARAWLRHCDQGVCSRSRVRGAFVDVLKTPAKSFKSLPIDGASETERMGGGRGADKGFDFEVSYDKVMLRAERDTFGDRRDAAGVMQRSRVWFLM